MTKKAGEAFAREFLIGWGDVDFNAHMGNTAFLNRAADTRMLYFAAHGFTTADFLRLRIGPVIMKDEVEYFREVLLLETVRVTHLQAGLAADCSRFRARNEFFRPDGRLAARVTSTGGWMDLDRRKLIVPPPEMQEVLNAVLRTGDFEVLPTSIK